MKSPNRPSRSSLLQSGSAGPSFSPRRPTSRTLLRAATRQQPQPLMRARESARTVVVRGSSDASRPLSTRPPDVRALTADPFEPLNLREVNWNQLKENIPKLQKVQMKAWNWLRGLAPRSAAMQCTSGRVPAETSPLSIGCDGSTCR